MNREEMEQLYRQLKTRHDAGEITIYQFRTEMVRAKIRDSQGRFWMIDPETGNWVVNAGGAWIEGTPPAELSSIGSTSDEEEPDWSQLRAAQQSIESESQPVASAALAPKQRLSRKSQVLILAALFILLALVFCALGAVLTNGFGIVNLGL